MNTNSNKANTVLLDDTPANIKVLQEILRKKLQNYSHHLEEQAREKAKEISESDELVIYALAELVRVRDKSTGEHIIRTQILCAKLAEQLSVCSDYSETIDDAFVNSISKTAALHDIGKLGIPDDILFKPGKLTSSEFEIIKKHPGIGANTLKSIKKKCPPNTSIDMGVDIAHSHHEKWDGTGYPEGLEGEEIPLAGRIMALVDVYDALISDRPYGKAFSHEKARNIILEGKGVQFDPSVVEAFESVEFNV